LIWTKVQDLSGVLDGYEIALTSHNAPSVLHFSQV
jgi:hypothetical protein